VTPTPKGIARACLFRNWLKWSDASCLAWFAYVLLCGLTREKPDEGAELRVKRDLRTQKH